MIIFVLIGLIVGGLVGYLIGLRVGTRYIFEKVLAKMMESPEFEDGVIRAFRDAVNEVTEAMK